MYHLVTSQAVPVLKLAAVLIVVLFIWALKSSWSERDACRDCHICTQPILTRMWYRPLWGPVRAVERIWLRKCPSCRHRLVADHGTDDTGRFLD